MQKNAYYFSHDCNARNDEKILMLRAEYGMEGYGIFWALIEMMFEDNETRLSHARVKGIAVSCSIAVAMLSDVIDAAISEKLFTSNGTYFWSDSLRKRKGKFEIGREKKSLAGKAGAAKRWNTAEADSDAIAPLKQCHGGAITENSKGKESKVNKKKEYTDFFECFWNKYPKKENKKKATDIFNRLMIRGVIPAEIMAGLDKYIGSRAVVDGFIMQPTRWLNEERWNDEYTTPQQQQAKTIDQQLEERYKNGGI